MVPRTRSSTRSSSACFPPFGSESRALIMAFAARTPCSWACWLTVVSPHQRDIG